MSFCRSIQNHQNLNKTEFKTLDPNTFSSNTSVLMCHFYTLNPKMNILPIWTLECDGRLQKKRNKFSREKVIMFPRVRCYQASHHTGELPCTSYLSRSTECQTVIQPVRVSTLLIVETSFQFHFLIPSQHYLKLFT